MTVVTEHKFVPVIIGLFVILILIGAAVYSYPKGNSQSTVASNNPTDQLQDRMKKEQNYLASLEKKVMEKPTDVEGRLRLARAYYESGMEFHDEFPDLAVQYFDKAVRNYQEVPKSKTEPDILVDMATAAFYGKKDDIAEKAFQDAVAHYPDYYQGHFNYGIFLYHVKQDYSGCLREWNTALKLKPTGPEAERLQKLIAGIQTITAQNRPTKTP